MLLKSCLLAARPPAAMAATPDARSYTVRSGRAHAIIASSRSSSNNRKDQHRRNNKNIHKIETHGFSVQHNKANWSFKDIDISMIYKNDIYLYDIYIHKVIIYTHTYTTHVERSSFGSTLRYIYIYTNI